MVYKKIGSKYVIRLDKGEEIVESLKQFCVVSGVQLATVCGIGAVTRATISIYELNARQYHMRDLMGDHEITNLTGNISMMNEEVYLHLHVNLSDVNQNTWGGHLNSAYVGGTCEIVVDVIDGELNREFDEQVGLNLINII